MRLTIEMRCSVRGAPEELANVERMNEQITADGMRRQRRTVTLDEHLMRDFLQKVKEMGEILNRADGLARARRRRRGS